MIDIFGFKKKIEERAEGVLDGEALGLYDDSDYITREQALQIPTVSACISKISSTISMLPIKLYKIVDGKPVEIENDDRVFLLNKDTKDTLNIVEFWNALISDYFLGFGGWAYINSYGSSWKSLNYVDCRNIQIQSSDEPIFKTYEIMVNSKKYYDFMFLKLLRKTIDGCTNIPLQHENKVIFQAAYNSLKFEKNSSKSGGFKGGFLKSSKKLGKEAMEEAKKGFSALLNSLFYDTIDRKIPMLNENVDFKELTSTATEMQINENKKTNSIEICKIFGFPHTILDGGASTEDKRQFIQSVTAILNQIETELDMKLLLESEKKIGYYFAFDTKELTRGSQLERYQAYEIGLRNRFLQVDDVRKEEDFEPMGFEFIPLNLSDVLYNPKTKEIYTPNTNQSMNLETMKGGEPNEN